MCVYIYIHIHCGTKRVTRLRHWGLCSYLNNGAWTLWDTRRGKLLVPSIPIWTLFVLLLARSWALGPQSKEPHAYSWECTYLRPNVPTIFLLGSWVLHLWAPYWIGAGRTKSRYGDQAFLNFAVSIDSFFWVSLQYEPYYFESKIRPLNFGNTQIYLTPSLWRGL